MVFVTGDLHGNFERFKPKYFPGTGADDKAGHYDLRRRLRGCVVW